MSATEIEARLTRLEDLAVATVYYVTDRQPQRMSRNLTAADFGSTILAALAEIQAEREEGK